MAEWLKSYKWVIAFTFLVGVTAWLLVGAIWFPYWWYLAIFTGDNSAAFSVVDGLSQLWHFFPFQALFIAVFVVLCVSLIAKFAHTISNSLAGRKASILAACLFTILFVLMGLNLTERPSTRPDRDADVDALLSKSTALLELAVERVGTGAAPKSVQSPIDFWYIDAPRTESMFEQLQPKMVEKDRKISSEHKTQASGKLEAGAPTVGSFSVNAANDRTEGQVSTFVEPSEGTAAKALDLINFCLQNDRLSYYNTEQSWKVAYAIRDQKLRASTNTLSEIENIPPPGTVASEDADKNTLKLKEESDKALEGELSSLTGLVLVDGIFDVKSVNAQTQLTEHFSGLPRGIEFEATVPFDRSTKDLRTGAKLRLFGVVIHPLGDQRKITVRPIAVF